MSGKTYTMLIGMVGLLAAVCVFLPMFLFSSGDVSGATQPDKAGSNMVVVYGAIALISIVLLVGYAWLAKQKDNRFILLFSCVATANSGYF